MSSIAKKFSRGSKDRSPEASKNPSTSQLSQPPAEGPSIRRRSQAVAPPSDPETLVDFTAYCGSQEFESIGVMSPTPAFCATPSLYSTTTFSTASFSDHAFELENLRRKYQTSQEDLQHERERA